MEKEANLKEKKKHTEWELWREKNHNNKNFNPSVETILEIPTRVPSSLITSPPHREKKQKQKQLQSVYSFVKYNQVSFLSFGNIKHRSGYTYIRMPTFLYFTYKLYMYIYT